MAIKGLKLKNLKIKILKAKAKPKILKKENI